MTPSLRAWVLSGLVIVGIGLAPSVGRTEPLRDFVMSASYGVLAGTLVGAATLAFSDKPGDNLNKVARGASFGLYAGILLGLYVVYGVPSQDEAEIRDQLGVFQFDYGHRVARIQEPPRLMLNPLISDTGSLAGGEVRYDVLRF